MDLNWLLNGAGEMRPTGVVPGAVFADILMVDQYERGTALPMQVVIGQVPFSRYFLEKKLRLTEPTHKTLLAIEAGGTSIASRAVIWCSSIAARQPFLRTVSTFWISLAWS